VNTSEASEQSCLCFCCTAFPNQCSRAEHIHLGVDIQKGCKSAFESFLHEVNQSDLSSDCAFPPLPESPQCHCHHSALLAPLWDVAPWGGFDPRSTSHYSQAWSALSSTQLWKDVG